MAGSRTVKDISQVVIVWLYSGCCPCYPGTEANVAAFATPRLRVCRSNAGKIFNKYHH